MRRQQRRRSCWPLRTNCINGWMRAGLGYGPTAHIGQRCQCTSQLCTDRVTTRLPASCSTHAVPPLFRLPSSFPLSLTRSPRADLVSLIPDSCTPRCGLAPLVYITLYVVDERALSSFSCGIQTFSLL